MSRFRVGTARLLLGVSALAAAAIAPGCDWLKGSDSTVRVSPFVSGLSLSPATVLCDRSFALSFRYDDPQDDISLLRLTLQHEGDDFQVVDQALWDPATVDLSVAGRAGYAFTLGCDRPGGRWTVTVQLEDLRGHTSNTATAEINLTSFVAP